MSEREWKSGDVVRFTRDVITDAQINYFGFSDPRDILVGGKLYTIETIEVHSWNTRVTLKDIDGEFNSVWFELFD